MAEFKPTPAQNSVIETKKKSLLVSAAAGSGKTAVLIRRIARMIQDGEADVSRLVVVTFTKAAAGELRRRLYDELNDRAAQDPNNARLAEQVLRLGSAQISTVHSFCFALVQEYKKECGLSGKIRVCDDTQAAQFLRESVEEEIEARLTGEESEAFCAFYEFFSDARSDQNLVRTLESLYLSADSYPGRVAFLRDRNEDRRAEWERLKNGGSFFNVAPGKRLLIKIRDLLSDQTGRLEALSAAVDPGFADLAEDALERLLSARQTALSQLESAEPQSVLEALCRADKDAMAVYPNGNFKVVKLLPPEIKPLYGGLRNHVSGLIKEISALLDEVRTSAADAPEDYAETLRINDVLIPVLEGISRRYREKKREKAVLDYADLEHLVLELVSERRGDGFVPTETGRRIGDEIDAIFVDEYQDTNPVQDRIFHAIARPDNLFIVGDPKQSVYRFRGADPEIFIRLKNGMPRIDQASPEQTSAKILLSDNFRCDQTVVDYVNQVFRVVMDSRAKDSLYSGEDELNPAKETDKQESLKCEWIMTRKEFSDPPADPDSAVTPESEAVAEEISAVLRGKIKKKDGSLFRPSEIAVLCRNGSRFPALCESLARRGISGSVAENTEILNEPETLFATSFLSVLDNPMDDVALIAALSSPVFRFSSDDLYGVRLAYPELRFFHALSRYAEEKQDETAQKGRDFLRVFFKLLEKSKALPLQELVWVCYETLSIRECYAVTGEVSDARQYLMDAARDFETFSLRSIPDFLSYLSEDRSSYAARQQEESVTVQTMHKSKGLEYPVVFAAFLGTEFNTSDEKSLILLSPRYGAVPLIPRADGAVRWESCLYRSAKEQMRASAREEEMRVLYVAMTRAKNKLYLSASPGRSKWSTKAIGAFLDLPEPLDGDPLQSVVRRANSHLEFLLAAAHKNETLRRALGAVLELEENHAEKIGALEPFRGEDLTVSFRGAVDVTPVGREGKKKDRAIFDPEELKAALSFRYRDDGRTLLPKKLSVSEILARGREEEEDLSPRTLMDFENGKLKNSAAFVGTSMHEVMQFARFREAAENLSGELDRLLREGFLTREAYDCLERDKLEAFFRSPFYARLAASPKVVHEKRFNVLLDGKDLIGKEGEVLVQGDIDVYFEKPDGTICVADFKTDRVRDPDGETILRERHGEQLRLYARAVEAITEKPVTELLLYSFSLGRPVNVTLERKIRNKDEKNAQ